MQFLGSERDCNVLGTGKWTLEEEAGQAIYPDSQSLSFCNVLRSARVRSPNSSASWSRSSRCRFVSFLGTSTATWTIRSPRPLPL